MTGLSPAALAEDLVGDIRPLTWNTGSSATRTTFPTDCAGCACVTPTRRWTRSAPRWCSARSRRRPATPSILRRLGFVETPTVHTLQP